MTCFLPSTVRPCQTHCPQTADETFILAIKPFKRILLLITMPLEIVVSSIYVRLYPSLPPT